MKMGFPPISSREDEIGKCIVEAAYRVHKTLGAGLLEHVYELCFCHELKKQGLTYQKQVVVPIIYDGIILGEGLRLDVLVEDIVICELKAADAIQPVYMAQILTYMKLMKKRLGYLINFNVPLIKNGIKRVVL
jgi:GxxExxY protein